MWDNKKKGICSLIAAILLLMMLGSLYTWSSINGYYASYLKYHDSPNITIVDSYFLMPIITFTSNFFYAGGAYVERRFGAKIAISVSVLLTLISHLIFLLITKLWIVFIGMGIFGMGIGFSYLAVIRNVWRYFPEYKGILGGIILCGYGLSALIFTSLADFIINPDGRKPDKNTGIYDQEIAERVHNFIFIEVIIFLVFGFICVCLTFNYNQKTISNDNSQNENLITKSIDQSPGNQEDKNESILYAICSVQFVIITTMLFCTQFSNYMIANTNRTFGSKNNINEIILIYMSKGFSFLNGSMRVVWGYLFDKFGFKILFLFIAFTQIAVNSCFYYAGNIPSFYFMVNMLIGCTLAGNTAIFPPLSSRIFGLKNSTEIYGVTCMFVGVSGILGPVLAEFVVQDKEDYLILYICGAALGLISFILCLAFKEDKLLYPPRNLNRSTFNEQEKTDQKREESDGQQIEIRNNTKEMTN